MQDLPSLRSSKKEIARPGARCGSSGSVLDGSISIYIYIYIDFFLYLYVYM